MSSDTNGQDDVFVRDRDTDNDGIFDEPNAVATTRVSLSSSGTQGNGASFAPVFSGDGRYVAFTSYADNLVSGDTNVCAGISGPVSCTDVFIRDRQTGQTTRVSVSKGGTQGNGDSHFPMLSLDGRYVAFYSYASNLVSGDTNSQLDFFIRDRQTGQVNRIENTDGTTSISGDGRFVAFPSESPDLVAGDTNSQNDIFVSDLWTGAIARVSVAVDGTQADEYSQSASISPDGRWITFNSSANTLVPGVSGSEQRAYTARNPLFPLGTPLRNNFDTATPKLTWNRLSWATAYHVQVARDSNFSDIVFEDDDLPFDSREVMVTPPLDSRRYYWRVRGLTDTSEGAWSVIDSFTIE